MTSTVGKIWVIAVASIAVASSCAVAPRTLPFEEVQKSGVSFWMISPIIDAATYAFYSDGNQLLFARSTEAGLRFGELTVSECPILGAMLVQFQESILDSVEIAFGREPAIPETEIVMDSRNIELDLFLVDTLLRSFLKGVTIGKFLGLYLVMKCLAAFPRVMTANKSLHWPPVGTCHVSCSGVIFVARTAPGAWRQ